MSKNEGNQIWKFFKLFDLAWNASYIRYIIYIIIIFFFSHPFIAELSSETLESKEIFWIHGKMKKIYNKENINYYIQWKLAKIIYTFYLPASLSIQKATSPSIQLETWIFYHIGSKQIISSARCLKGINRSLIRK